MIKTDTIDFHSYLPPYRSLLSPNARYDYRTHSLVPLSQNELNLLNTTLKRKNPSSNKTTSSFKMKYRSLLSDVSRSLSIRISNPNLISNQTSNNIKHQQHLPQPLQFANLPIEIADYIFKLIDNQDDYRRCLFTSKLFYQFAKPYFYEHLFFTSTYRFAQFITYLRLNSEVGLYVKTIDLSQIKPCNNDETDEEINGNNIEDVDDTEDSDSTLKILAGWRDWKFKNNPLYSIHPHPSSSGLTKIVSNSQVSINSNKSSASNKSSLRFSKPFKYFKSRKRSKSSGSANKIRRIPKLQTLDLTDSKSSHPRINKYLLNYSSSKDLPIGYILHLINLCPNIVSLNLGSLSLSTDYEIKRSMIYKYQTFDLMNNYPKDLIYKIDDIMGGNEFIREEPIRSIFTNNQYGLIKQQLPSSSASSVYSITPFSKPIRKYNSLLPPLPQTVSDMSYFSKGDGKVYLSDLNLKSINNIYLTKLNEDELLSTIINVHGNESPKFQTLKYINLSSMIWLNKNLVQWFLKQFLSDNVIYLLNQIENDYESEIERISSLKSDIDFLEYNQDLVIDLTDSGMYKNLQWAKLIDLSLLEGCKLANNIIENQLLDGYEEYMRRERIRRGRIAENYLS